MIKSIIIDDEAKSLTSLEIELKNYCPQVEIIGKFQQPLDGINAIKTLKPDLVFLDIHMPGMDGFELLEQFDQINFHVIFVTAFNQYAIKAFDFNAIDYIMKPVRKVKLIQAVEKVEENLSLPINQIELKALLNNLNFQQNSDFQTIAIPTSSGYELIHIDDINYLHAQNNYTWIYRLNGDRLLVSKPLKHISEMIRYLHFYRTHKSYVVNLKQVIRYVRSDGGYVVLKDKTEVPVSRTQKEGLVKLLKN